MRSRKTALTGRVVAITGGARGIGAATAAAFRDAGALVAIGDIDRYEAKATAKELGIFGSVVDVTDSRSMDDFVDRVEAELGPLDVMVNNAGIMPIGSFLDQDPEIDNRVIDINLRGVLHGSRSALTRMRPRRTGHVVNIASVAGRIPAPGSAVYCATKHAVIGFSEALAAEVAPDNVRVSTVLPSFTKTAMISGTQPGRGSRPVDPETVAAAVLRSVAHNRAVVTVPRYLTAVTTVWPALPLRAKRQLLSLTGMDDSFVHSDSSERAEYDRRIRA